MHLQSPWIILAYGAAAVPHPIVGENLRQALRLLRSTSLTVLGISKSPNPPQPSVLTPQCSLLSAHSSPSMALDIASAQIRNSTAEA